MNANPKLLLPVLLLAGLTVYLGFGRFAADRDQEEPQPSQAVASQTVSPQHKSSDPLTDARVALAKFGQRTADTDQKVAALMEKYDASKLVEGGLSMKMKPFVLKYSHALNAWGISQDQQLAVLEDLTEYERQVGVTSIHSLQQLPRDLRDADEAQKKKGEWIQKWQSDEKQRRQLVITKLEPRLGPDRALTMLRIRDAVESEVRNAMPESMAEMRRRLAELNADRNDLGMDD